MPAQATDATGDRPLTVVRAVVPCFNRGDDLRVALDDLSRTDCRAGAIALDVLVVDNASDTPLTDVPHPDGLKIEHLRLPDNLGGSGGYNAGMARALRTEPRPGFVWLVDSDARVDPDTLKMLLDTLARDPDACAVGPALCDPDTKEPFEIGGRVEPWGGGFMGEFRDQDDEDLPDEPFGCDYVAACCALVRADAIERTGLFPEVFLNGDDVEWFIRLADETGRHVLCDPHARGYHPRFDKVPTSARYFLARNAYGSIAAKGYGALVRFRRARVETMRALNQIMMNRVDLARLHMRGLRDAARGRVIGRPRSGTIEFEPFRPYDEFAEALDGHGIAPQRIGAYLPPDIAGDGLDRVLGVLGDRGFTIARTREHDHRSESHGSGSSGFFFRAIIGQPNRVALVPAKGRPAYWLVAPTTIQLAEHGFAIVRQNRLATFARVAGVFLLGQWYALRLAVRGPGPSRLPSVDEISARHDPSSASVDSLSIVVLSYNRKDALAKTLRELAKNDDTRDAELIVVDNASSDGTREMMRRDFPAVPLIELDENIGVDAFNVGVREATGDAVLILDDDSHPDQGAVSTAMAALRDDASLAAVTLEPVHPASRESEWAFAPVLDGPDDAWPVMGCGNLVRRRDWLAVGGYERDYFLYRNDTDLAMKLLAAGRGVRFDPSLTVWHDSPAAAAKSTRWFRTATRNWVWLCKRHGGDGWRRPALMGWAWAHKTARLSPKAQLAALRGGLAGLFERAPTLPEQVQPDGSALAKLLTLQLSARRR
jgi:GT2 family glycosyltransferase